MSAGEEESEEEEGEYMAIKNTYAYLKELAQILEHQERRVQVLKLVDQETQNSSQALRNVTYLKLPNVCVCACV